MDNSILLEKIAARLAELDKELALAPATGLDVSAAQKQIFDLKTARESILSAEMEDDEEEQVANVEYNEEEEFAAVQSYLDDETSLEEEEEDSEEPTPKAASETNAGFQLPPDPGPGQADPDNVTAMPARMRRQIGQHAADFLDEYGQEVHRRVIDFVNSIREKALCLGEDGQETPLREQLREEVGGRGLRAIEPVFEEWREILAKRLAADIKNAFPAADQPSEIPEEAIPSLVGISYMEKEEKAASEKKPKKGKKGKKKKKKKAKSLNQELTDAESSFMKEAEKEDEEEDEAIVVASGPIKMTVSAKVANDFTPSGYEPVILE